MINKRAMRHRKKANGRTNSYQNRADKYAVRMLADDLIRK